jgi:transcriptional regulator with XRE-family HTH domain
MSTDSSSYWKNFPSSLSVLIKSRTMKKQDLARAVGVSPPTVSQWLAGKLTPGAEVLFKLADVFGVSVDRLIGRVTPGAEALYALRAAGLALDNIIAPPEPPAPRKARKY